MDRQDHPPGPSARTIRQDHPTGPSARTIRQNHPPEPSARTIRQDHPPGPSDRTIRQNHPPGPSDRTIRQNHPTGPSARTICQNHPPEPSARTIRQNHPPEPSARTIRQDHPPEPSARTINQNHLPEPSARTIRQDHQPEPSARTIRQNHPPEPSARTIRQNHPPEPSARTINQNHPPGPSTRTICQDHPPGPSAKTIRQDHQQEPSARTICQDHPPEPSARTINQNHPPEPSARTIRQNHPPGPSTRTIRQDHPENIPQSPHPGRHRGMWSQLVPLVLLLLEGCRADTVHETVQAWKLYQEDCEKRLRTEPPWTGVFCNRTFDMYVCWGDAAPNTTHAEPCPSYLPWYAQVRDGFVFRRCGADGQWVRDETDMPWRDHSQCENVDPEQEQSQSQAWILSQLRVMYSVGYGISLAALVVALCILTQLRRLRCTRNLIHCNLFLSFILRAVSLLSRDALLTHQHSMIQGEEDLTALLRERTLVGCRVAQTITQYCVAANYYWLLVEGLYLHNLLLMLSFSEEAALPQYMVLGWGELYHLPAYSAHPGPETSSKSDEEKRPQVQVGQVHVDPDPTSRDP
ncbi:gastric inhibitory polypeptide receptor isoform X2 [Mixophyes fleayi]|uniref:gastric inhibitory polypeptide receptor isoform X2 n=1 Tax=Mixophyes fleayi TaxID=3061075 RepID=UPI003F4E08B9